VSPRIPLFPVRPALPQSALFVRSAVLLASLLVLQGAGVAQKPATAPAAASKPAPAKDVVSSSSAIRPPARQFPSGESYVYEVEWRLWRAGTATLRIEDAGTEHRVVASADSTGVAALLYTVRDRFEAFFDRKTFVSSPVNEVGYRLARGEGNVRRLYRRESYYVDGTPLQGGDYFEVYDRVLAFDVLYVGYRSEEDERKSQDTLAQHKLDTFESWNSEERRAMPTALVVTLTVEPPQLAATSEDTPEQARPKRTFLRIIQLVQADDILPPKAPTNNQQTPGTQPGTQPGR